MAKFAVQYKLLFPNRPLTDWMFDGTIIVAENTGLAVAAVYFNLVVQRRWFPDPNWLDRLAFIVGLAWIASILTMNV